MIKLIKLIVGFIMICILGLIFYLNAKLYYQPNFSEDSLSINTDVVKQLHFLKSSLHNGAATEMQQTYPEGFVFTQAVYGLSWAEVAVKLDHNSALYKEAHEEISYALNQVQSPQGRNRFDRTLPIPFGVYYAGWSNYLLGTKLSIENARERNAEEVDQFQKL